MNQSTIGEMAMRRTRVSIRSICVVLAAGLSLAGCGSANENVRGVPEAGSDAGKASDASGSSSEAGPDANQNDAGTDAADASTQPDSSAPDSAADGPAESSLGDATTADAADSGD
jgi:hypothetical protein